MQNLHIELLSVTHSLEESPTGTLQQFLQFAFYPEFTSFGHKEENLLKHGKRIAKEIAHDAELDIFSKRALPESIEQNSLHFSIKLSRTTESDSSIPLSLKIPYLHWKQNDHTIAFLPSLGIEVISNEEKLKDEIISQTEFYLKRTGKIKSLLQLALLERQSHISIERHAWNPTPLTAKEFYKKNYEPEEQKKHILNEVATRMWSKDLTPAFQRDAEVESLYQNFSKKRPNSILLVGPAGCGKTSTLHELIRVHHTSLPKFWKTSGSRLIAGQTGYGMWQQRCRDLIDEVQVEPIILSLGNLFELMQVGQSSCSTESIASYLRPSIERGNLIVIAECTKDQYSAIELYDPKLLDAFSSFPIEEASPKDSLQILNNLVDTLDWHGCIPAQGVSTIHSLHQRFARYSAQPGKAVVFTKSLIEKNPESSYTVTEIVRKFSEESGLPTVILDDSESFSSSEVTNWFNQRVMAQPKAVEKIVAMLTTVKSRLSRPNKPLGSFMFIGPTGVGKTEMAKTMAEYLYGDKDRIIRFDMSEYNSPQSAQRLVSDSFSQKEGLLTAAVREQPFSIILLDEFEKGALEVYDLFLQVLGEGRLTDGAGRLADFSNSIIILTSNLGAQGFNTGSMGFPVAGDKEQNAELHFTDAVRKEVRPEFFNRIDHIVPFFPLTLSSITKIAERELSNILKRDGLYYSNYSIEIDPPLLEEIISGGYDVRYGARPLKRAIEQHILLPLAQYLDCHSPQKNGIFKLTKEDDTTQIEFHQKPSASKENDNSRKRLQLDQIAHIAKNRRLLHQLDHSSMIGELRSEVFRIQQRISWKKKRALKELARDNPNRRKGNLDSVHVDFDPSEQVRLSELEKHISKIDSTSQQITEDEEKSLLDFYADHTSKPKQISAKTIESLIIQSFTLHENCSSNITLIFRADSFDWLMRLIEVYTTILQARDIKSTLCLILRKPKEENIYIKTDENGNPIEFQKPEQMAYSTFREILKSNREKLSKSVNSIAIHLKSKEASLLLRSESGLHSYEFEENKYHRCQITVHAENINELEFPLYDTSPALSLKTIAIRREYTSPNKYHDSYLSERGEAGFSQSLLEKILHTTLLREAYSMLD